MKARLSWATPQELCLLPHLPSALSSTSSGVMVQCKCKSCKLYASFHRCDGYCWTCAPPEVKKASGYKCSQPGCLKRQVHNCENCWNDASLEEKEATGHKCITPGCPKMKQVDDYCCKCFLQQETATTKMVEARKRRRLDRENFNQALEESTIAQQDHLYEVENRSE